MPGLALAENQTTVKANSDQGVGYFFVFGVRIVLAFVMEAFQQIWMQNCDKKLIHNVAYDYIIVRVLLFECFIGVSRCFIPFELVKQGNS